MHRSKLSTFVLDCQTDDVTGAATFWGGALGLPVRKPENDADLYRDLVTEAPAPVLMVQAVKHPSRIHLDIETDDIEAEVARLEALGARRVEFVKRWWVMEAPTGQRFCVVNPQRGQLSEDANTWP